MQVLGRLDADQFHRHADFRLLGFHVDQPRHGAHAFGQRHDADQVRILERRNRRMMHDDETVEFALAGGGEGVPLQRLALRAHRRRRVAQRRARLAFLNQKLALGHALPEKLVVVIDHRARVRGFGRGGGRRRPVGAVFEDPKAHLGDQFLLLIEEARVFGDEEARAEGGFLFVGDGLDRGDAAQVIAFLEIAVVFLLGVDGDDGRVAGFLQVLQQFEGVAVLVVVGGRPCVAGHHPGLQHRRRRHQFAVRGGRGRFGVGVDGVVVAEDLAPVLNHHAIDRMRPGDGLGFAADPALAQSIEEAGVGRRRGFAHGVVDNVARREVVGYYKSTMVCSREESQERLNLLASGIAAHRPDEAYSVADAYEELAREAPEAPFLIDGERRMSFGELNREANRYARALDLKAGDSAAMMLENRLEFFVVWLALTKLGVIATMLNTQMRGAALAHALKISDSRLLLLGEECAEALEGVEPPPPCLWVKDVERDAAPLPGEYIDARLGDDDGDPDRAVRADVLAKDPFIYCFTSGTTGLPKAAIISHARWIGVGVGWQRTLESGPEDVFYCVLPLFHGAAGMSLVSHALAARASIVMRRRFSASRFWPEVRERKVTIFQYIGEICRYLINLPPSPDDRDHTLRCMTGAGLSAEVWRRFTERFGDIRIVEGLGATESNANLSNLDGKVGAVGRVPFKEMSNARLVRYDMENGEYARDANGHLIECEPNEPGELIGMIVEMPETVGGRFEGYSDEKATESKILRDVFAPGDAWFATGDMLRCDEDGYFYFVDRLGDTFRWKSENVSTTEVVAALEGFDDAEMINVYGVRVPEQEGRAGMVAIQMRSGRAFDGDKFYQLATSTLPPYAVPLFARISPESDMTATFKLRKVDLQKQGYAPENFGDDLYALRHSEKRYAPFSEEALEELGVAPFEDQ